MDNPFFCVHLNCKSQFHSFNQQIKKTHTSISKTVNSKQILTLANLTYFAQLFDEAPGVANNFYYLQITISIIESVRIQKKFDE